MLLAGFGAIADSYQGAGAVFEAGDVLITLYPYLSNLKWLIPGQTYSSSQYPDAAAVYGDSGGTFTVASYTPPSGLYAYAHSSNTAEYDAGEILLSFDPYISTASWLIPGEIYNSVKYPDAALILGDDGGTFTVDAYPVPSGYYSYVYSGV